MIVEQAFCQIDGLRIAYRHGGSGPPLVLLHHAGGSSRRWSQVIPKLSGRWTVFAPDLPGHGESEVPEGDAWKAWRRFLPAAYRAFDLGSAPVVAHSLSGVAVAQNLLGREIDPSVAVLIAPPASHDLPAPIRISRDGAAERAATWKSFKHAVRARLAANPSTIGEEDWQAVHDDFVRLSVQETLRTLLPGYPNVRDLPSPHASMPPVEFLWGDRDRMVPEQVPSIWAEAMPNGRHHTFEGVGHLPMLEAPKPFLALLNELLR